MVAAVDESQRMSGSLAGLWKSHCEVNTVEVREKV